MVRHPQGPFAVAQAITEKKPKRKVGLYRIPFRRMLKGAQRPIRQERKQRHQRVMQQMRMLLQVGSDRLQTKQITGVARTCCAHDVDAGYESDRRSQEASPN